MRGASKRISYVTVPYCLCRQRARGCAAADRAAAQHASAPELVLFRVPFKCERLEHPGMCAGGGGEVAQPATAQLRSMWQRLAAAHPAAATAAPVR